MAYTYGSRKFTEGVYGGADTPYALSSVAGLIDVFDNNLNRKGTFQSGVGGFVGCDFTLDENGSRDFALYFTGFQNIALKDIVKIKLFNSLDYFFTGVVRDIPIEGSTKQEYNYSGYGLNDYLHRISTETKSYANKTLSYIVNDLLDTIIVPKTPIRKNAGKIILPAITVVAWEIKYDTVIDDLELIKQFAQSSLTYYIFGVDSTGDFYFMPKSTDLKTTLIVGKKGRYGISAYEPTEDAVPKTKYFVLDKDGVYVTTISTSDSDNDIYEEKLTAPDIDNASIALWAAGKMVEQEISVKRASIEWQIENIDPLVLIADGMIRIISNIPPLDNVAMGTDYFGDGLFGSGLFGGEAYTGFNLDDTLEVKEVKYEINASTAMRQIELGNLPARLDTQIMQIKKELTDTKISLSI